MCCKKNECSVVSATNMSYCDNIAGRHLVTFACIMGFAVVGTIIFRLIVPLFLNNKHHDDEHRSPWWMAAVKLHTHWSFRYVLSKIINTELKVFVFSRSNRWLIYRYRVTKRWQETNKRNNNVGVWLNIFYFDKCCVNKCFRFTNNDSNKSTNDLNSHNSNESTNKNRYNNTSIKYQ